MANDRLFKHWNELEPALKTGKAQNETQYSQKPMFETLYEDPARLEQFIEGMVGASRLNFQAFATKFDFLIGTALLL